MLAVQRVPGLRRFGHHFESRGSSGPEHGPLCSSGRARAYTMNTRRLSMSHLSPFLIRTWTKVYLSALAVFGSKVPWMIRRSGVTNRANSTVFLDVVFSLESFQRSR